MHRNLLAVINSNNKKKPYSVNAKQIGVTRNAVSINPLTGYNVSTGNVMTQVANSSVVNLSNGGNFATDGNSDGLADYWSVCNSVSSRSVSNNIQSFTAASLYGGIVSATYNRNVGDKIYITAKVKAGSSNVILQTANNNTFNYTSYGTPTGDFKKLSLISTALNTTDLIYVQDNSPSGWTQVQAKEVMIINLTATFGKGFEPTQAWCDENIPFFMGTLSNPTWINPLVTHNQYAYVGGDTTELTFDFGTKVAGSTSECPMKIFYQYVNLVSLPNPSTGWTLIDSGNQSTLDLLKTQDNNSWVGSCSVNGYALAYLIELDLSAIANQYYGGSISALKSALKLTNIDIWAKGSGSNSGVDTNGCRLQIWNTAWSPSGWVSMYSPGYNGVDWYTLNTTGSIVKMSQDPGCVSSANRQDIINNSNGKIYILVHSMYASNGTISSLVFLDYAKITIGLNRTVDSVSPRNVNLPKYFGTLVKGWSPSYDNNSAISHKYIFQIRNATNDTQYNLWWNYQTKSFVFTKRVNGVFTDMVCTASTHSKYQTYNILCGQTPSGMFCRFIPNNGSMVNRTNAQIETWQGKCDLYVEQLTNNVCQGDSFINVLQLYDLQKLGKVKISSKNLMNKADIVQGSFSGAVFADSTTRLRTNTHISVTPNTTYTISFTGTNLNTSNVVIREYDANKTLIIDNGWINPTFTTRPDTRYVRILVKKIGDAVIVPSDLSTIQLEMGSIATTYEPYALADGFDDYEAESILRGDNKYYRTSTSDYVGKVPGSVVENPNIFRPNVSCSSLQPPSVYGETSDYSNLSTLNGVSRGSGVSTNGFIPVHAFSVDLIREVERKYGPIPNCNTVAEKVAWLRSNVNCNYVGMNWYGWGSCPNGYKCTLYVWNESGTNAWCTHTGWSNVSSSPAMPGSGRVGVANSGLTSAIDNNGFVHFLACTDAAKTTGTDYAVITNHGLSLYDVIENVTRSSQLVVITGITTNGVSTWEVTGQVVGDTIKKYHVYNTKNAEAGTNGSTIVITNHGLSTGEVIKNNTKGGVKKVTVVDANTFTISSPITGQVAGDTIQLLHLTGTQTAEGGVIASTIYTDYVSFDVIAKTGNSSVYVPNTELFDVNSVTLNFYATRNNGVVTLNATGSYQESYINIPVLPNNKYELTGNLTGANGYIVPREYYNNNIIRTNAGLTSSGTITFTTGPNTNYIRVLLGSSTAGTFTFNNISLKLKM